MYHHSVKTILEDHSIEASAPCRIDMGGTLDIKTIYYPLNHLQPATFNLALKMRTHIRISSYKKGMVKVTSAGFEDAEYAIHEAPFNHPMGIVFALASYYNTDGIHIDINSSSPPKSALGGSSAALMALVAAFSRLLEETRPISPISISDMVGLAHSIEESVLGTSCGTQDHLSAAYGGVNAWLWQPNESPAWYQKKMVIRPKEGKDLEKHLLLAYCGEPHDSVDINRLWLDQFLAGKFRKQWKEIIQVTQKFIEAIAKGNYDTAIEMVKQELVLRLEMTPHVLDEVGYVLVDTATRLNCGARFTGAGGGGCIWSIGKPNDIHKLKEEWTEILQTKPKAHLLSTEIDFTGVEVF